MVDITRNATRAVAIGGIVIGDGQPIAVQSMTATATSDVEATTAQVNALHEAGADVVRIAVDNQREAEALAAIRGGTEAVLAVDLQENYRLAEVVAPQVDKIRYNPGHLYHHERNKPWQEKVRYLAGIAGEHDCAMRVGVNCGSVDPARNEEGDPADPLGPMLESALEHCELLDEIGFSRYCVPLKDSDPSRVVEVNRRFAEARPEVPLHLGVTEAGLPPDGIIKTRIALEQLVGLGIGDTIRVSLTVSNARKPEEITAGRGILGDIAAGRVRSVVDFNPNSLNIISCPSCARQGFDVIKTVETLEKRLEHIKTPMSLSIIGCVVNGPGEALMTDVGFTGGGAGSGMVYLAGKQSHKLGNEGMIDHIVEQVEERAAQIEAEAVKAAE